MKTKLLLFILSFVTFSATSQEVDFKNLKKGKFKTYITSNGLEISVGDTLTFGNATSDKGFQYLSQGGDPVHPTRSSAKAIISKIKVLKNGISLQPWVYVKGFGLIPVAIDIEQALKSKEIKL